MLAFISVKAAGGFVGALAVFFALPERSPKPVSE